MPTVTQEFELDVAAPRLWAALKDSDSIFPKIAPQMFSSIVDVEGEKGHVGYTRQLNFGPVAPEGAYVKEKLVFLDHDSYTVTTAETEGGHLAHGFSKWVSTIKFVPHGSKAKVETTFDYEGGDEAAVEKAKEGIAKLFKGLAAHINSTGAYA